MTELGRFVAPVEFKFITEGEATPGTFEGYASVFGTQDWHGDMVMPGAFTETLAEHKAAGTMPGLFAEHSFAFFGGDPLPIGKWLSFEEDDKGLRGVGKISALDSDHGKRIIGLMRDGALPSLSIAYEIPDGGSRKGKQPGEPKRWLDKLTLHSVDVVHAPSNPQAKILSVKAVMAQADHATALSAIQAALALHEQSMSGGDSPTTEERAQMRDHLRTAHRALTGNEPKSAPNTIRGFEEFLHDEGKYSRRVAREIAARGWKAALSPRDEAASVAEVAEAMKSIAESLRGLTFAA
jgi:hypothetical protein